MSAVNHMTTHARNIQPPRGNEVIGLENVSWEAPDGVSRLRDVTFSLYPGDFAWIKGYNGSGKSTIERVIVGLEPPTAGDIRLFGQNVQEMSSKKRMNLFTGKIGLGFQKPALKGGWTVYENLIYYPEITGTMDPSTHTRIDMILNALGLTHKAEADAATLSGGQQQQIALGALLVRKPALLVLDEPTSSMDMRLKETTLGMLSQAARLGTAVLMANHDEQSAAAFVNRQLDIHDGRIVSDTWLRPGPPHQNY
jgi:ABC-type ATPase involved in cell division